MTVGELIAKGIVAIIVGSWIVGGIAAFNNTNNSAPPSSIERQY